MCVSTGRPGEGPASDGAGGARSLPAVERHLVPVHTAQRQRSSIGRAGRVHEVSQLYTCTRAASVACNARIIEPPPASPRVMCLHDVVFLFCSVIILQRWGYVAGVNLLRESFFSFLVWWWEVFRRGMYGTFFFLWVVDLGAKWDSVGGEYMKGEFCAASWRGFVRGLVGQC